MKTKTDAAVNNHYGAWIEVKKPFPYGFFFTYYQMKHGDFIYFDRKNKLDKLFDFICRRLK